MHGTLLLYLRLMQVLCYVMAFCCAALAGFPLYPALTNRELATVRVADLEAGKRTEAIYLDLEGEIRWDLAFPNPYDDGRVLLVPMVSDGWKSPKPVAVYVQLEAGAGPIANDGRPLTDGVVRGCVDMTMGIGPGLVDPLARAGIPAAPGAIRFNPGATPNDLVGEGLLWLAGAVASLLGGFGSGRLHRWLKRKVAEVLSPGGQEPRT